MANTNIDSLLLYELRGLPRSPRWLQGALKRWDHDVPTTGVVSRLAALRDQGLVDGPGISLLHHLNVDLTQQGRAQANALRDFGGWRRMN